MGTAVITNQGFSARFLPRRPWQWELLCLSALGHEYHSLLGPWPNCDATLFSLVQVKEKNIIIQITLMGSNTGARDCPLKKGFDLHSVSVRPQAASL